MRELNRLQKGDIISTWDNVAQEYQWDNYWDPPENKANLHILLSHIGDPNGKQIIELGCGSGFTTIALAKLGALPTILDISPISIERAVLQFKKMGLSLPECFNEDALNNSLPSNSYDVVWNGGVIEHFYKKGKELLIREMYRIAKTGGKVIIIVPNLWCWQFQMMQAWLKLIKKWPYGFERDMSPKGLIKMCKRLGIEHFTSYAFNRIVGWRWVPKIEKIIKLVGLNTFEQHCKRTWMGFVSILIIQK